MNSKSLFIGIIIVALVMIIINLPTRDNYDGVTLNLDIDYCSCNEYSSFNLTWEQGDASNFDPGILKQLLIVADSSGLLLCDCSRNEGDNYFAVIESIDPLSNEPGFEINLIRTIWLTFEDVEANLTEVLNKHKERVFFNNNFRIKTNYY
ncbi:MAG: hypothetical protein COU21_00070 [Candidatus Komeilibacteria bacterium CG10_big_fil_rev_8_21_14_0_10_36_65]|nr:MAG: hypothetical protein COU21_00070 [Candidatus Komeilibacteria bacterium CG10_big_fil_rev_8_21_14_0_10_36_65]PJC55782.1 MAG: hypothetical protein CO027_00270 [Candidatus Komeilibacteria bacterium CG_4_9_14_0_2_um_filter_36_13]